MEEWRELEEFPGYEVSNLGQVRNANSRHILGVYDNGRGVMQVVMQRERRNTARAVHKLVASAFLDVPPGDYVPIHLDTDWNNNRADNLEWKPRWYAVARTNQLKQTRPTDNRKVREVKTGIIYANALECARAIGGLERLVVLTAQNQFGATYLGSAYEFVYTNT